jgi:hypothetical protein
MKAAANKGSNLAYGTDVFSKKPFNGRSCKPMLAPMTIAMVHVIACAT